MSDILPDQLRAIPCTNKKTVAFSGKNSASRMLTAGLSKHWHRLLAVTAQPIFVMGKPFKADAPSFEVLSEGYARDKNCVFLIMATKLKPVKAADAASFKALDAQFGHDATTAFFRDRRLKLSKGKSHTDLTPLGHVYATDGEMLFFTTERHELPDGMRADPAAHLRLRWMTQDEVNCPFLSLTDGQSCWVSMWTKCEGADFETLTSVVDPNKPLKWSAYTKDATHLWFRGELMENVDPSQVRLFGGSMLTDGARVWCGHHLLAEGHDALAYIGQVYGNRHPSGALVHHGDRLVVHHPDQDQKIIATKKTKTDAKLDDILTSSLREVFATLFAVFTHAPALVNGPTDALELGKEGRPDLVNPDAIPAFNAQMMKNGRVVVSLSDGTRFEHPISAWYTLACHLWCHSQGRSASFLPYPPLGTMLPRSTAMHSTMLARHKQAFWPLMSALFRDGFESEARIIAHMCFHYEKRGFNFWDAQDFEQLVSVPRPLMTEFHYTAGRHSFGVTTNLAVGRHILNQNLLDAEDFRARIDALDTLHGCLLSTNKRSIFLEKIIPEVMEHYLSETLEAVREHIAMVLEAALIAGQVDCEMSGRFHHAAMLPIIEFCIAQGVNVTFNRARLAETLWALDRDDEANHTAETLIAEIGEDAVLPGVYVNRHTYRTPRLWFLRGKVDISYREGSPQTHRNRLNALKDELAKLKKAYGADAKAWKEFDTLQDKVARYENAVEQL